MLAETPAVLDSLYGVWRRTLLVTETSQDTASHVWWLQSATLYVELRLPDHTADPCRRPEGFAGYVRADGELFYRFHAINLNPGRNRSDTAVLRHQDDDTLVERDTHRAYAGHWSRVSDSSRVRWGADLLADGPFATVVLVGDYLGSASSGPSGVCVLIGKRSPAGWTVLAGSNPDDSGSSLRLELDSNALHVHFGLPDRSTASQRWEITYEEGEFPG